MLADSFSSLDSFLFLFFSMIVIAITLYLPQHIAFLTNRAWFYYHGDENNTSTAVVRSVIESAATTSTALVEKVKETVVQAAVDPAILSGGREL